MKFNPQALICLLNQCGFTLWREPETKLVVTPADRLTPEMQDAIRRHKMDLLPFLPECQP